MRSREGGIYRVREGREFVSTKRSNKKTKPKTKRSFMYKSKTEYQ